MSAVGLLVVGGSGDGLRGHGSPDARGGPDGGGPVRNFFWQSDGSGASRSSMRQGTAGAGRRDNGVVDDAVPDLVRCPRDGPHPRRGRARRGQGRARGGPGGRERRCVGFGGGLENQRASIVATDGTVADGPYPEAIGGFCVVEVSSLADSLE